MSTIAKILFIELLVMVLTCLLGGYCSLFDKDDLCDKALSALFVEAFIFIVTVGYCVCIA